MIDNLIIKSEIYRKKENELKEKDNKIEYLSDALEEFKRVIGLKDDEIRTLKGNIESLSKKLNKFNEFLDFIKIIDEVKRFKDSFLSYSKITKNETIFHDKDKIYINKKFLEENFFKTYQNMLFKDKLHLLKLLNLIDVSEGNRFTKKVFVNGKYKRMIVFNRYILDFYCNLCS
ncbi:hypothetical protein H8J86_16205 [Clostridium perfringens]|uniref:hypothetical protein n=1 Tax=Clostridium perfringens TaxID=1502 RepID=UPI0018E45FDA|nr:hypothetical protein [Clostridium perfringens]MBI6007473.1 hypothetical protein [Clostridium perfringens]MDM0534863.1 hypothetical protein [Clostridium perfringens]MDM0636880.1 hypothetical protein [Clostridium perfringens]